METGRPGPAICGCRSGRTLACITILFAGCFLPRATFAAPLTYSEQEEVVVVERGGTRVLHRYRADQHGFVSDAGDWVGWDDAAQNWLAIPKDGAKARYDTQGNPVWQEQPKAVAKPGVYNPALDVGDTPAGGSDLGGAWQYLGDREKAAASVQQSGVGDEGGSAVAPSALGGDVAGKEKKLREEWSLRPSEHQGKPESAMETGEVVDPLKKLADTIDQIKGTVQGVDQTIKSVDQLEEQIDNFGKDGYDGGAGGNAGGVGGGAPPDAGAAMVPAAAPSGSPFVPPQALGAPVAGGAMTPQPAAGKPPVTSFADPASMLGGAATADVMQKAVPPQPAMMDKKAGQ